MIKSKFWILGILVMFLAISFTSCKDDDEQPTPAVNEAEVLGAYLAGPDCPYGKDFVNTDMPAMIKSTDVYNQILTDPTKFYIIDIRSDVDYGTGHIEGAVNVAAGNVLAHLEGMDVSSYEKIIIVCYTGQTAGWVTSLLRLLGYNNVYDMKWGMCSWHDDYATKWKNAISNQYWLQFTTTATDKDPLGIMPSLSTGQTTGLGILEARAIAIFAEGFGAAKVTSAEVFGAPDNYYIVNYWKLTHYDVGHIPGAIQYSPKADIAFDTFLKTLPTDKTIAVYCYTGQTSAHMTAYLRLLGYDAKSLLYGCNGMMYDEMVTQGDMTVFDPTTDIHSYPSVP